MRILSTLALLSAIVVGANVIVGTTTAWHAFTSLCLYLAYNYLGVQADKIFDLNDPSERELVRENLIRKSFLDMIEVYSVDTIMQYELVPFNLLRGRCYVSLLGSRHHSNVPQTFVQNADRLLHHRIITPEMHRMIIENDIAALERLPNNTVQMDEIFSAYDNR